ncbi:MAG: peroxiredoxin family protein, partial [bacterium]|nr:peroxiredoxin family protein [bacterium]
MRDSDDIIRQFDVAYFMASLDAPEKNADFARSLDVTFPILSDPSKEAARAYGVRGLAGLYAKRWTFFIDPEGIVQAIDRSVRVGNAGRDLAEFLEDLDFP